MLSGAKPVSDLIAKFASAMHRTFKFSLKIFGEKITNSDPIDLNERNLSATRTLHWGYQCRKAQIPLIDLALQEPFGSITADLSGDSQG
jgi:hypothetical protein